MSAGAKTTNVSDEGDQRGGGEKTDAGNAQQTLNRAELFRESSELLLHTSDSSLELAALRACLEQRRPQRSGKLRVRVFDKTRNPWDDVTSPTGMKVPSSRKMPRRPLSRAVRVASQAERRR